MSNNSGSLHNGLLAVLRESTSFLFHVSDSGRIQTRVRNSLFAAALTVHFNDLVQVGEDGGQLGAGQELLSLQRPGEDCLKDT